MKLFDKIKAAAKKADPRSQPALDKTRALLFRHGITSERSLNECSLAMFWQTFRYFKMVDKGKATDKDKKVFEGTMLGILSKHGITEEKEQDELLCEFFNMLKDMAEPR